MGQSALYQSHSLYLSIAPKQVSIELKDCKALSTQKHSSVYFKSLYTYLLFSLLNSPPNRVVYQTMEVITKLPIFMYRVVSFGLSLQSGLVHPESTLFP